jgi:hypothetical protein
MILDDVTSFAEPEFAERRKDMAFFGDRIGQDHIEGADAVRGDEQQHVAKIEYLAYLAAFEFFYAVNVDLRDCVRHGARLKCNHSMNPSRKFKENVLVVGFFLLSVAVVVILVVGAWKGRTSVRASTPTTEQVNH